MQCYFRPTQRLEETPERGCNALAPIKSALGLISLAIAMGVNLVAGALSNKGNQPVVAVAAACDTTSDSVLFDNANLMRTLRRQRCDCASTIVLPRAPMRGRRLEPSFTWRMLYTPGSEPPVVACVGDVVAARAMPPVH